MEKVGEWLAWLAHGAMWVQVVWFLAACAIGIPWIIRDEVRFRRTAPKPSEVAAYADRMEAAHGREALSVTGQAMVDAHEQGDFQTRRFLKEVSGELVRRMVALNRVRSPLTPQHLQLTARHPTRLPTLCRCGCAPFKRSPANLLDLGQKSGTVGPELREERTS